MIEKKEKKLTIYSLLFVLSGVIFNVFLLKDDAFNPYFFILAGVALFFAEYTFSFSDRVFKTKKEIFIFSGVTTVFFIVMNATMSSMGWTASIIELYPQFFNEGSSTLYVFSLLSVFCIGSYYSIHAFFIYICEWLWSILGEFFAQSNEIEKKFFWLMPLFYTVLLAVFYTQSSVAYTNKVDYYGMDIWIQTEYDAFFSIKSMTNDYRQPLFALFASPIMTPARAISSLFGFSKYVYSMMIGVTHGILMTVCAVMLARIMFPEKNELIGLLLFSLSFPTLIYVIGVEQYPIACFYLILSVYAVFRKSERQDLCFTASTGTLLTSGASFFFFFEKEKIVQWIELCIRAFLIGLGLVFIFGRANFFNLQLMKYFYLYYKQYSGNEVMLIDKSVQYFQFILYTILSPNAFQWFLRPLGEAKYYYATDLVSIETGVSALLWILALIGFVSKWRERGIQICGWWVLISFALMFVVGWGANWHEMVLYSLYFNWAFIPLLYYGVSAIGGLLRLHKYEKAMKIVGYSLVTIIAILNLMDCIYLLRLGIAYAPLV